MLREWLRKDGEQLTEDENMNRQKNIWIKMHDFKNKNGSGISRIVCEIIFLLPLGKGSSDDVISSFFFNGNFSNGGHDDLIQFFQFNSLSRSFFITMENLGPFGGVFC